ncbi:MAG: carboxypeptidase regulatory-like domain-containing protein [Bacteroidota bacterium]
MKISNFFKTLGLIAVMVCLSTAIFAQGVTTSSLNGKVIDEDGQPLIGANILAVHTPTGTTYGNSTNVEGLYRIPNMRVGGPYKITVSYTGYEELVKEGIFLRLGQSFNFSITLSESAVQLAGIEVVAARNDIFDGNRTGAETTITEEQINALPTVARSLGDFTRLTPQSTATEGNDGFALSFAGQNNRYNAIYIDGAVNNDVFGLAGSGTNGGQTGVSPIALDAIEELQISIAPFDVRVGGFAGAAISAITRSGTNNWRGTVYTFYRDENFVRDELAGATIEPFTAQTTGLSIGGPIIKDKLFFFFNGEIQRETTPLPFSLGEYIGDSGEAELNNLVSVLQNTYNYDPGTFTNNERFLDSEKFNLKFDYNFDQNNKFALRLGWVRADNLEGVQSDFNTIAFLNSSERFVSNTYSGTFEWNSIIGSTMANNLTVGFTAVRDDRDPNGTDFPYVFIDDGSGSLFFGSERFSTANLLNTNTLTVTDNFEIYAGNHTITLGTHLEFFRAENLFVPFNFGAYEFASVEDFVSGAAPVEYERSFSLVDNVIGDESDAIAAFNSSILGFYIQDEVQVTDDFKVTVGLRVDQPIYDETPTNEDFNNNTIPLLEESWDLRGARTGQFIEEQLQFSPRFGFNWDVNGLGRTQIRGGLGIFTSRAPLVWVGGAYNNYGLNRGTTFDIPDQFEPDPGKQPPGEVDLSNPTPSGDIDLFAEDFQLPQFLKANLVVDQKLGNGLVANFDFLYTRTIVNVAYQNVNLKPSTQSLTGTPDNRLIYDRRDEIDPTYGRVLLGYNVNDGYAYNLTASLTKNFNNGFFGTLAYSFGDSYAVFDGTSSQNSSQWRGLHAVNGRNIEQGLTRSDFAAGSRIIGGLTYEIPYAIAENFSGKSTFSLIYEGQQGRPYSYIYNDRGGLNNEDSRERNLIYVPENREDIILVEDNGLSPDQQWALLDRFIDEDPYLSTVRGQYAQRNQNFAPWSNVVDLRFLQDFTFAAGGKDHTIQLTVDIVNFTNLLNPSWGQRPLLGGFGNVELLNFEGFIADPATGENTVPTFSFDPNNLNSQNEIRTRLDDAGIQSSRWQMNLGVRYIFE